MVTVVTLVPAHLQISKTLKCLIQFIMVSVFLGTASEE